MADKSGGEFGAQRYLTDGKLNNDNDRNPMASNASSLTRTLRGRKLILFEKGNPRNNFADKAVRIARNQII